MVTGAKAKALSQALNSQPLWTQKLHSMVAGLKWKTFKPITEMLPNVFLRRSRGVEEARSRSLVKHV